MPIYSLGKKSYEIFPKITSKQSKGAPSLDDKKLEHIASFLSEYFGCFIIMGMSLKGEPQLMVLASSGMEMLSLKQFAQDVLLDSSIDFIKLKDDEDGDDDDERFEFGEEDGEDGDDGWKNGRGGKKKS